METPVSIFSGQKYNPDMNTVTSYTAGQKKKKKKKIKPTVKMSAFSK